MNLTKLNILLKLYSIIKLPLLAFTGARVIELSEEKSVVKVNLGYRTRNHLGVMYFGALAIGAELSIAVKAVEAIFASKEKIDFIFKDFRADFLRRCDGDVHFVCMDAAQVKNLILEAEKSNERLERRFLGQAYVPSRGPDPVMTYQLTLSVKKRKKIAQKHHS